MEDLSTGVDAPIKLTASAISDEYSPDYEYTGTRRKLNENLSTVDMIPVRKGTLIKLLEDSLNYSLLASIMINDGIGEDVEVLCSTSVISHELKVGNVRYRSHRNEYIVLRDDHPSGQEVALIA
jgi:hypothetical protein